MVLLPPGEIYTALERGTLDATEFVGPHDDLKLGFQNAARYYYYPGWHEPTSIAEFSFNKKAYDALPAEFRHVLNYATEMRSTGCPTRPVLRQEAVAMQRLTTEFKTKVELIRAARRRHRRGAEALRSSHAGGGRQEPDGQEGGGLVREVRGRRPRTGPRWRAATHPRLRRVQPRRRAASSAADPRLQEYASGRASLRPYAARVSLTARAAGA